MSKVRKGKQIAAVVMAVALSAINLLPYKIF